MSLLPSGQSSFKVTSWLLKKVNWVPVIFPLGYSVPSVGRLGTGDQFTKEATDGNQLYPDTANILSLLVILLFTFYQYLTFL